MHTHYNTNCGALHVLFPQFVFKGRTRYNMLVRLWVTFLWESLNDGLGAGI